MLRFKEQVKFTSQSKHTKHSIFTFQVFFIMLITMNYHQTLPWKFLHFSMHLKHDYSFANHRF